MIVVVIVLAVLAVGLLIGVVALASRAGKAAARITELQTQADEPEQAALASSERADKEAARAVEADGRAIAADKRASEAEQRAADAEQRTEVAEEKVAEAIDRADRSEERALAADDARAVAEADQAATAIELATALEVRLFDADGMWALGRRRMERLWRDRLRLLPDEDSPLDGSERDPEAAVRLMTEASREESGVVVDLTWSLAKPLSPARAALVVLLAEELIAVARESDGGELDVTGGEDEIVVALRADPATEPATVAELDAAVASFGWRLDTDDPAVVVVHVPLDVEDPSGERTDDVAGAATGEATEDPELGSASAAADERGVIRSF
jgi:hypothetical protein